MFKKVLSLVLSLAMLLAPISGAQAEFWLPSAVTTIESDAFLNDASISGSVTMPANVKNIGDNAFAGTDVFALWLPSGAQSVGNNVLAGTDAVYAVVPSRYTSVGSVDVPFVLSYSGSPAHQAANAGGAEFIDFSQIAWHDGFCYRQDAAADGYGLELLFALNNDLTGTVTIPAQVSGVSVTAVNPYAFARLDGVTAIELPETAVLPSSRVNWPDAAVTTYAVGSEGVVPEGGVELSFELDHISMNPGEEAWVNLAEDIPAHEGGEEWQWYTGDEAVASFWDNTVVAKELGETAVTLVITCGDGQVFYATMTVSVVEPMLDVIIFDTDYRVQVGVEFYPNWEWVDSSTWSDPEWHWISDNEEVVEIGEYGQLIAIAPGVAYCTIVCEMAGLEAGATVPVTVYEPELELNHYSIMAYSEHDYQLSVLSEIPEGASVSYVSSNPELLSVSEDGLVSVLAVQDALATTGARITVTLAYADGTSVSETCTFEISEWLFEFSDVDSLEITMGENQYCWPRLRTRWWTRHAECYTMSMEVEDESILSPTGIWTNIHEGPNVNAYKTGTTNVTFKAAFDIPDAELSELNYIEKTIPVTVVAPYMEAYIGQDQIYFHSAGHTERLDCWYDSSVELDSQYFTSSDESVATVDANGLVTAKGPGEATITYHICAYGIEVTASVPVTVEGCEMTLNKSEATIAKGEGFLLIPTISASDASNIDYHYYTANQGIVYVDDMGYVTGLAAGVDVVYCEAYVDDMNCRAMCKVTVTDDAAPITLNATYKELVVGDSFTLVPTFSGEATDVTFASSNSFLASVDENGVVTMNEICLSEDYPVITVSAMVDGVAAQAHCTFCSAAALADIRDYWGMIAVEIGWTEPVSYSVATVDPNLEYTVSIESMDEGVLIIDENGWAKAVGQGATELVIKVLGSDGTVYAVQVTDVFVETAPPAPTSIAFERDQYLLSCGDVGPTDMHVWPSVEPDNCYAEVRFESLNPQVATINENGWVEAVAAGETTIRASAIYYEDGEEKSISATAQVYVADVYLTTDKEVYAPGDIATISLANFPEDLECEHVHWDFWFDSNGCTLIEQSNTTLKVRVQQPGEYGGWLDVRVNNDWHEGFEIRLIAEGEWNDIKLNETDVTTIVGELVWIGPDFGLHDLESTIGDDSILRYVEGDICFFEMIGTGETTVTFTGTTDADEAFELTANVKVVEPQWQLLDMNNIPDVMQVGEEKRGMPNYTFNGYWGLEQYTTLTFSDTDVACGNWQGDGLDICAVGAGVCTVTATTTLGGRTETMSKQIVVTEPALYTNDKEIELRPGEAYTAEMIVGGGREIQSLTYTSGNASLVTVDASGVITAVGASRNEWLRTNVYAHAVFTDGTEADAVIRVTIIPDEGVYAHVSGASWAGLSLATQAWGALETTGQLWVGVDTNAADHEISYVWSSGDETIAAIDADANGASEMTVTAVGEGWAEIECIVSVGQEGDSNFWSETLRFGVNVVNQSGYLPDNAVQLAMEYDAVTLNCGEVAMMYLAEDVPAHDGGSHWDWCSTNDGIVWPGVDGEVRADQPGTANYMIVICCDDGQVFYGMTAITVVEPWIELYAEAEFDVPVGGTVFAPWSFNDSSTMSDPSFTYEWSDDSVMEVDEWGRVVGKAPGVSEMTVYAYNGVQEIIKMTINVYEPAVALNYYTIQGYTGLEYQIEVLSEHPEGSTITYTSSDETLLSVTEDGIATGLGEGSYEAGVDVTVKHPDGTTNTSTCTFWMDDFRFEWANTDPLYIEIGKTEQLWPGHWVTFYEQHRDLCEITIEVADESVVSYEKDTVNWFLDEKIATAHKLGSTKVTYTVTYKLPEVVSWPVNVGTFDIHVVAPEVDMFVGDPTEMWGEPIYLNNVGTNYWMEYWWEGDIQVEKQYLTSSDESIFTVDANGMVTATGVGTATATYHVISDCGVEYTASVDVIVEGYDLTLSETEVTLEKGESFCLLAYVDAPDGANVNMNFESMHEDIAYVGRDDGMVTALKQGTTVIRVSGGVDGRYMTNECVVHVTDDAAPIRLQSSVIYVLVGDTFTLEPTFAGEATDITFGTDDEERLPIDANGVVTVVERWENGNHTPTVWCEATVDGQRVKASMLVRMGAQRADIHVSDYVRIENMEERYHLYHEVVTNSPDLAYMLEVTSSDENVVVVEEGGWYLKPIGDGEAVVTFTVYGTDGTVYASKDVDIFVNVIPTLPEQIVFERDYYVVQTEDSGYSCYAWVGARLLPEEANRYYGGFTYSVEDPSIAMIEEPAWADVLGLSAGETTVTASLTFWNGTEEQTLTASVPLYVVDLSLTADKESYDQFELATLTLNGLPEEVAIDEIHWDFGNSNYATRRVSEQGNTLTVRTYQPGTHTFGMYLSANGESLGRREVSINVNGEWTERLLNEHDVTAAVGETIHIYPTFGTSATTATSSDTSLITVDADDPSCLKMVGAGEATVTYSFVTSDTGETVERTCHFVINEPQWEIMDYENLPGVMRVGQSHWGEPRIESNFWNGLSDYVTLSFSDPAIVSNELGHHLDIVALEPGTVTITATVDCGGKVESISKEVLVIEPTVYPEAEYVEWRPNSTHEMDVIVTDDRTIESVEWTSGDDSLITVNADGTFTVQDVEGDRQVRMNAVVRFTDGSSEAVVFRVYIVPDWNVYLRVWEASWHTNLNTEAWSSDPQSTEMFVNYDTNAAAEEISVEWRSTDESIFTLGAVSNTDGRSAVTVNAVAVGSAQLECIIKIGEDGSIHTQNFYFSVNVQQATLEMTPESETLTLSLGEARYLNFWDNVSYAAPTSTEKLESSDTSVVMTDVHGNIQAVGAGTATVTRSVYIRDILVAQADVVITVNGARIGISAESVEVSVGETAALVANVTTSEANMETYVHWESVNPQVAMVDENGTVYAIARGITHVFAYVDTPYGTASALCKVIVEDENLPVFMIDYEEVTMISRHQAQLSYVLSDDGAQLGTVENVTWHSNNDDIVSVDENGLLTAHDVMEDGIATITCTAELGGQTYTAYTAVRVTAPKLRIVDNGWAGEGCWRGMGIGETEEIYALIAVSADMGYTVEYVSDNESVIVVHDGYVEAVGMGEANVTMTVTGDNGEVITADRYFRVEMEPILPTSLTVYHESVVLSIYDYGWSVPVGSEPMYSVCELVYGGYDTNVITVNEHGSISPVGVGRTTVNVTEINTGLTASFDVVVYDPNQLQLKAENDATSLSTGESVQLVIDGGAPWTDEDVEAIWYDNNDGENLYITEDGKLTCLFTHDHLNVGVPVHVRFVNGHELELWYWFSATVPETYFFARLEGAREFITYPGNGRTIEQIRNFEPTSVTFASSNEAVATVNADGYVECTGVGEATITITAAYADGTLTDTIKVIARDAEVPVIECHPEKTILAVGETVNVYVGHRNDFTCPPDHDYISGDSAILLSNGYQEEYGAFTITGVAPGVTTLTVVGNYGELTAQDTVAIIVTEAE